MNFKRHPLLIGGLLGMGALLMAPMSQAELEQIPVTGAAVTTEITGTVEVVNTERRMLTIKTPEGRFEVIHVPEEVERLDQVKIGNRLTIDQTDILLVDLEKGSDAGTIGATEEREIEREPGAKPAGTMVDTIKLYGRVESVDTAASTLTIEGPERTLTFQVEDPALLEGVAPGDGVVATYIRMISGKVEFQ